MTNGWFPKINYKGQVASGNNGIWLTENGKSTQVSPVGIGPFWIGDKLCYNRNNNTTQIGSTVIPIAYNDYCGSDKSEWTGFIATGNGHVDFYADAIKTNQADGITLAKYAGYGSVYGFNLAYMAPFQSSFRTLVYNNVPVYQGMATAFVLSLGGILAWQIATGTYTRQIHTQGNIISIRDDEAPVAVYEYLGQSWILTQTHTGLLTYPFGSVNGYYLRGDCYYPDCRIMGNRLLVVGSDHAGNLITRYIDFSQPRIDLRKI